MSSRSPGFTYKDNALNCEDIPISVLAKKYGTPLYVYSAAAIQQRYHVMHAAFRSVPHTICYSVKANSNLSILRMLAKMGAGFDIVSGGELERVKAAQKKALKKVVFSGVGKTQEELEAALRSRILLFNVESEGELDAMAACAARFRKRAEIAVRVNPDVPAETHPYISTGLRDHKFGVPITAARALYQQAARCKYLHVTGVSLHIGSQIRDMGPFSMAVGRAVGLAEQLTAEGHEIRFLDAGGGLGISYQSETPMNFKEQAQRYADAILSPIRKSKRLSRLHLLLEPGRSIVAPAGALVTRVLYQKQNAAKRFTIVDAAMNDLIRPSLYQARHEIVPVELGSRTEMTTDVCGPICESGDFLARDASLPELGPGSLLCVYDTGAYGMALASNYNTRPRAAEVLVEGSRARLIRWRETVKNLLASEVACL
jgi:diaminopimelate decarboxylase